MLSETEKQTLKKRIQANQHEIYVISMEEMEAIIQSSPNGRKQRVQIAWAKIKGKVGTGVNYYASADDAVTMAKLIGDLGGAGARAYIKLYGGKPHIILKGHPGLRTILTGTKYGIKNPKVVTMGLGKAGAVGLAKRGGILTVILLSVYRVADYFLTDEATLNQLVGTLATDIVKVGVATGASIVAATLVAGLTTVAIGPILAVIVVGVGVSMLLDYTDNRFGITERIIAGLDKLENETITYIEQKKAGLLGVAEKAVDEVIDYAVESVKVIAIRWVRYNIGRYLKPAPVVR